MTHLPADVRDLVRDGASRSAQILAERICAWFDPATVIDVGCGEGHLTAALRERGVQAFGVDGDDVGCDMLVDLNAPPYPAIEAADVVTCLEVAEHVDRLHAAALVEWLTSLAPVVVFSAAIPYQGGWGHVNEQPPGYWAGLFDRHGCVGTGAYRADVWNDDDIESWYRQNLLVFAADRKALGRDPDGCPYLVHPDIWEMYRA